MPEVVLGILVALLVYELTNYSPGGIITAAYVSMYIHHWEFIAGTTVAAFVTWGAVAIISRYVVLYGRRLYSVYLVVGLLISQMMTLIATSTVVAGGFIDGSVPAINFYSVGYLLPGLVGRDFSRQGVMPTLGALLLTVGIIRLAVFAGRGILW